MNGNTRDNNITTIVNIGKAAYQLELVPNDGRPYVEIKKEITDHYPDGTSWTHLRVMKTDDIERNSRLCEISLTFFHKHTLGASLSLAL